MYAAVETDHQQALDTLKLNRDLLEAIALRALRRIAIATQLLKTKVIEGEKLHSLLWQVQAVNNLTVSDRPNLISGVRQ
ncbi:hypothetical protein NIES2130_26810 [Scytonema sp. HK-05]|nr:hypothetical protein NIES2130_26810 [Scytonema sp. HK-05]